MRGGVVAVGVTAHRYLDDLVTDLFALEVELGLVGEGVLPFALGIGRHHLLVDVNPVDANLFLELHGDAVGTQVLVVVVLPGLHTVGSRTHQDRIGYGKAIIRVRGLIALDRRLLDRVLDRIAVRIVNGNARERIGPGVAVIAHRCGIGAHCFDMPGGFAVRHERELDAAGTLVILVVVVVPDLGRHNVLHEHVGEAQVVIGVDRGVALGIEAFGERLVDRIGVLGAVGVLLGQVLERVGIAIPYGRVTGNGLLFATSHAALGREDEISSVVVLGCAVEPGLGTSDVDRLVRIGIRGCPSLMQPRGVHAVGEVNRVAISIDPDRSIDAIRLAARRRAVVVAIVHDIERTVAVVHDHDASVHGLGIVLQRRVDVPVERLGAILRLPRERIDTNLGDLVDELTHMLTIGL